MKTPKVTEVEVSIPKPQVHQVTTPSHSEIWEMLLERKRINDSRNSETTQSEINPYPYPKIDQLISETKMAGRYGLTALWHPANHPDVDLNKLINGRFGLRVACDIGYGFRSPYLFHESQIHRILR